jgi:nitroreductase
MTRSSVQSSVSTADSKEQFFELLKTRHACRQFDSKPIPDQVLARLAYAAHRAPTGGNVPYRFVIVVKDPRKLKMLKLVSPGYEGESSAAIVICTDTRIAGQGLGSLGTDQCALYDAGAAAENVHLAAHALGLGSSFIKSYSERAVKRILELPESSRTELLISLGYPAKNESRPLKKRKDGSTTYRDRYGDEWKKTMNDTEIRSAPKNVERKSTDSDVFELAMFLLTSARGCVTEPRIYGSLRLVEALSKLTDVYPETDTSKRAQFLRGAKKKIDENKSTVMSSETAFVEFVDEMIEDFTEELKRRYSD